MSHPFHFSLARPCSWLLPASLSPTGIVQRKKVRVRHLRAFTGQIYLWWDWNRPKYWRKTSSCLQSVINHPASPWKKESNLHQHTTFRIYSCTCTADLFPSAIDLPMSWHTACDGPSHAWKREHVEPAKLRPRKIGSLGSNLLTSRNKEHTSRC